MSPTLSALVAFELQRMRIAKALISAAPTRLTRLPESPAPFVPHDTKPRTVTPYGMAKADRQRIYHARHRAKVRQQRTILQARRERVT